MNVTITHLASHIMHAYVLSGFLWVPFFSCRSFEPLDIVICALQAIKPCSPCNPGSSGSPGAVTAASVGPSKAAAEADRETRQPEINITEVSHEWSQLIVYYVYSYIYV